MRVPSSDSSPAGFIAQLRGFNMRYNMDFSEYGDLDEMGETLARNAAFALFLAEKYKDERIVLVNSFGLYGSFSSQHLLSYQANVPPVLMSASSEDGCTFLAKSSIAETCQNARPFFQKVFETVCGEYATKLYWDNSGYDKKANVQRLNAEWVRKIRELWEQRLLMIWIRNSLVVSDHMTQLSIHLKESFFEEIHAFIADAHALKYAIDNDIYAANMDTLV